MMKKKPFFNRGCRITALVLILCLCASSVTFAASYKTLDYETVLQIAADNHAPLTDPMDPETLNMKAYYHEDSGLLTQDEIKALRKERRKAKTMTKEEAMEDADLFFRTWKYAYSAYYFMGEELFENAREEVMKTLRRSKNNISGQNLGDILYDSMRFLQDAHSTIDGRAPASEEASLRYEYYYDSSIVFSKDGKGVYVSAKDGKWYYQKSSNRNLRIEPTLLKNGKVVYSPMLLIPVADAKKTSSITLKKGSVVKKIRVSWKQCKDVQYLDSIYTQCKTESLEDIYYINYLTMDPDVGDVNDFLKTADKAKKHKAVIFDLRYTQGCAHWQLVEWIRRFTGQEPAANKVEMVRNNALRTLQNFGGFKRVSIGNEEMYQMREQGKLLKNDVPVIILTDKSVLSSVESAMNYLRTMENTIVIGSNSLGCQLGGSVQTYYLPHSGVPFAIGGFVKFCGERKLMDGIGYEPDLWCEPEDALRAAVDFLKNNSFLTKAQAETIKTKIDPVRYDIRVHWFEFKVKPTECFGDIPNRAVTMTITAEGKKISDYTVKSGDATRLEAKKLSDGRLQLRRLKPYEENVPFTISYKGVDYIFYTND